MMKRTFSLLLIAVAMTGSLVAQTVDEGRKFFYYERFKSAKETFDKVLAANPNSIDAVYWLGQTLLKQKDSVAAKALYQKYLSQNGNAPLLLAGIGQIELMEGKTADARQRFELALNTTKAKDIDVLNAVGRANAWARFGDANYAIEKLNQATQVKGFKDPETYLLMGDAYRRLVDGGNAIVSYNKALSIDPKLAAAKYDIGKVYLTQRNTEFFLPAFEEAIQLDPAYAPAYNELSFYYFSRDINKSKEYLDKYAANTDQGPELEYTKADYQWFRGDYAGARTKAQELIKQYGDKVEPRMYRMVAYTSDSLGDMAVAKQAMLTFLSKADPEDVLGADYAELANISFKTPGSEAEGFEYMKKAIKTDSVEENRIKYVNKAADFAKKLGNKVAQADWLGVAYGLKKNPNQNDLYNWGFATYQAADYLKSDSIFAIYEEKYPKEIFGPWWRARSMTAYDSTGEKAAPHYEKFVEVAKALDSVKYKGQIVQSLFILAGYANDVKKDKDAALNYLTQITFIDPANEQAPKYIEMIKKSATKPSTPQSRPKSGGNASTSGGASK